MLIAEGDLPTWIPALGNSAAVLVSVFYFLRYMASRDKDNATAMEALVKRVEAMQEDSQQYLTGARGEFLKAVQEAREQNRQITDTLFAVSRETIQTTSGISQRVGELVQEIRGLRAEVHAKTDRHPRDEKP